MTESDVVLKVVEDEKNDIKWVPTYEAKPWRGGEVQIGGRRCITVYGNTSIYTHTVDRFGVNWPAFGTVPVEEAEQFQAALGMAIMKAKILTQRYAGCDVDTGKKATV